MLKRIFIVALCLCLLVVLVACKKGGDKGETELPVEENNTTESGTTENGSEGGTTTDQNGGSQNTGNTDNTGFTGNTGQSGDNSTFYYDPETGTLVGPWVP